MSQTVLQFLPTGQQTSVANLAAIERLDRLQSLEELDLEPAERQVMESGDYLYPCDRCETWTHEDHLTHVHHSWIVCDLCIQDEDIVT